MYLTSIVELVRVAPTPAAAASAFTTLRSLASTSDNAGILALTRILAAELGYDCDAPGFTDSVSLTDLLSSSDVPALLKLYALGYQPREFLANGDRVERLSREIAEREDLVRFKRVLLRDAPAQHEILRAYVLAAFGQVHRDIPNAGLLKMLDRVDGTRVIPGVEANSTPEVGRDLILSTTSRSLLAIITHEIGHWSFEDALLRHFGDQSAEAASGSDGASDSKPDARDVLADFRTVLPRIVDSASRLKDAPLQPGDPRGHSSMNGVTLICTEVKASRGEYLHLSLTNRAEPIGLSEGALYALGILRLLGVSPGQAAIAHSPRGVFHFGFRGGTSRIMLNAGHGHRSRWRRSDGSNHVSGALPDLDWNDLPAATSEWLQELERAGHIGSCEADIAVRLGLQSPAATIHCSNPRTTIKDIALTRKASGESTLQNLPDNIHEILAAAIRCGDPQLTRQAIAYGGAPDVTDEDGTLCAFSAGRSLCVISAPNHHEYVGPTVDGLFDVLSHLRAAGVDLNADMNDRGDHLLSTVRHVRALRFYLAHGVQVDGANRAGETALFHAVRFAPIEVVQGLLEAGANVRHRSEDGATVLHDAVERDDVDVARLLLNAGSDANAVTSDGDTPLNYVRSVAMGEFLVSFGADVNYVSLTGETPLMRAASHGRPAEVLATLLTLGADPNTATLTGLTPLHYAVVEPEERERSAKIAALLDAGAALEVDTDDGDTPLVQAIMARHVDAALALIARGANVNAKTRIHQTPLIFAVDERYDSPRAFDTLDVRRQLITTLLQAGADPNAADRGGYVALHYAAKHYFREAVTLLLAGGAKPDIAALDGATPLHIAALMGGEDKIEPLVSAGANINAPDEDGNTPLLSAIAALGPERVDQANVEALLKHGVTVLWANAKGETAVDLCRPAPDSPVARRINQHLSASGVTRVGGHES